MSRPLADRIRRVDSIVLDRRHTRPVGIHSTVDIADAIAELRPTHLADTRAAG
jgi:hypothetical protein